MAYRRIAYAALLGGAVLFQIVFRFYLSTFTPVSYTHLRAHET